MLKALFIPLIVPLFFAASCAESLSCRQAVVAYSAMITAEQAAFELFFSPQQYLMAPEERISRARDAVDEAAMQREVARALGARCLDE